MFELAGEFEDLGQLESAADMYRAALAAGGPTTDGCFRLAELLYQLGDLAAARERYYIAIELDENFVEARANLGCVLAETGQHELAVAAFEGALATTATTRTCIITWRARSTKCSAPTTPCSTGPRLLNWRRQPLGRRSPRAARGLGAHRQSASVRVTQLAAVPAAVGPGRPQGASLRKLTRMSLPQRVKKLSG